jgi:hypothetical protein
MGIRPPQGGGGEPDAIEFGITVVDARLDETSLSFPATSREIVAALDSTAIPYDAAGNTLELSAALDRTESDRFDSEQELLEELHPVFERHRERAGNSIVARLRGLLPL